MGYTGGNTERKEGRRKRTGEQDGRTERGRTGEDTDRKEERKTRKVGTARKTAPSSPTKNHQRETEKRDPKRKTRTKNPEKENGLLFSCLFLNSLDLVSFIVSSF
jgi:hypothetical protein